MRISLTTRLALLFALLTAALLVALGWAMERAVEAHFRDLDAHELSGKITLIRNLLVQAAASEGLPGLSARLNDAFAGHANLAVRIQDPAGTTLYGYQLSFFDHFARLAPAPAPAQFWSQDGQQFIGQLFQVAASHGVPALNVAVALDISHHEHFLQEVGRGLRIGVALAALVAAVFGWFAARSGLSPLRRVSATARALSAEQLGERLTEQDAPAEVSELVDAFNGMLERLESSFQRLREYSADIAHELRTPISNLMTQTQVALTRARSEDEYREVLMSNLEEFQRIARMVSDMLFLAQTENGRLPGTVAAVDLGREAAALIEFYEALAEEQGVTIVLHGSAQVPGDALMLRRALSNLLSNALRHTPRGGTVSIEIHPDGSHVRLDIANPGEPIPPGQLSRVFERFHRVDADHQRRGEGAGLGLAITRSIIRAHGGDIGVRRVQDRTVFSLSLPLSARQAGAVRVSPSPVRSE